MAGSGLHGWTALPDGRVLARFHATDPSVGCGSLDVFVAAPSRREAVARAKALGLHGVNLTSNASPPTAEEVRAFVAQDQEMLWRRWDDDGGRWLGAASWPVRPS